MIYKRLAVVAAVVGAAVVLAQTKPELTARELFFVPAAVNAAKKTAATPKPTETKQVAQNTRPTRPVKPQPTVEPQEIIANNQVKLVTASYSGPKPMGIRYSVLKRMSQGWEETNADSTFRSGDAIRVRVETNENGYMYVVAKGSSGSWDVLFPAKEVKDGDNYVEAGEQYLLPNRLGLWRFDDKRGEEKLFLVLSRRPVSDLDKLIYDLNQTAKPKTEGKAPAPKAETKKTAAPEAVKPEQPAGAPKRTMLASNIKPIDDQLVGRLRSQMLSRDLVFEKIDETGPTADKKEAAVYVVETSGKTDARLVVDIKLKHD